MKSGDSCTTVGLNKNGITQKLLQYTCHRYFKTREHSERSERSNQWQNWARSHRHLWSEMWRLLGKDTVQYVVKEIIIWAVAGGSFFAFKMHNMSTKKSCIRIIPKIELFIDVAKHTTSKVHLHTF